MAVSSLYESALILLFEGLTGSCMLEQACLNILGLESIVRSLLEE